jgi:hypothetical protein
VEQGGKKERNLILIILGLVIIPNITWLSDSADTRFILACVGILVVNLTINIVLFVPKWLAIHSGKEDSGSLSTPSAEGAHSATTVGTHVLK